MKAFGFLSFGHYANVPGSVTRTAGEMLHQTIEIAQGADEIGVNGASVRVHHFARQAASPTTSAWMAPCRSGNCRTS